MIKKISSSKIDWLVSQIVNDESLMRTKPVLAGGSMLSVYKAYRLYDSDKKWKQLERAAVITDTSANQKNYLFNAKVEPFGDIDAWYFSDSLIHNGGLGSWMLADVSYDIAIKEPLNQNYRIVKKSKWANSFRKGNDRHSFVFQAIKTPINSIEDLFSTFDFLNCCVAYYDGDMYYDSRLDDAFENFSLELNNSSNYNTESMTQRVYAGLRAFKYSKRYMLDFSKELAEKIYQIYIDIETIDYSKYNNKVALISDVYGSTLLPVNDFRDMVRSFELKFKEFAKMSTFREDYALFLINRTALDIRGFLADKPSLRKEKSFVVNVPF